MPATKTITVVDTTFSVLDMGALVVDEINTSHGLEHVTVVRRTVPGFKDLTAASRAAIDGGASLVVACGMPGPEPIDESCAKDASFGLQMTQALTGVPVLEVFVHMSEALDGDARVDPETLSAICRDRCRGHANNAVAMVTKPESMIARAGTGRRQGAPDVGALRSA